MNIRLLSRVASALLVTLSGAAAAQDTSHGLARDLDRLARGEHVTGLPSANEIPEGPRTIAAGSTVTGTVVSRGPLDVFGTVNGTAVSLAGNVVVHKGGVVTGDAIAVGGQVMSDSGRVDGEMRSMSALPSLVAAPVAAADTRTPFQHSVDALRLVAGTFGVLLIVAIGVLLFAGDNLDEVVATLEQKFGRAFWMGLVGQVAILPVLAVLLVALALSVIGILLIPFAIVAYAIAVAGIVTLGFLAVTRLIGGAVFRDPSATPRARALRALAIGLAGFLVLWLIAAGLGWAPLAATVVRAAALAATWAAMTLGLGAAILSRAGTHRRVAGGQRPVELASWQTPTPLTGVVAARRPAAVKEAR